MASFIETEMLPVGQFLSKPRNIKVPEYQRSYAWTEDEVSQFWEDIKNAIENDTSEYFIGPIVTKDTSEDFELIDGQQRLTTIMIILSIIRRVLLFSGDEKRASWFQTKFFGEEDVFTMNISEKFFMNDENSETYRGFVLKNIDKETITKTIKSHKKNNSNKLLLEAILTIWDCVENFTKTDIDTENTNENLLLIFKFINEKLNVLVLSVEDEANAFVIFETLNDRGRSLDTLDLLKNHLFAKSKTYLSEVKTKWAELRENLLQHDQKNKFLQYYWASYNGRTTRTDLFRLMRDDISTAQDSVTFCNKLLKASRVYAALQNPESDFWSEHNQETKSLISQLKLVDTQQPFPILMAAYDKFDDNEFRKLIRIFVTMTVRYNLICELRTGVLSNSYSDIPLKIRDSSYSKASHIFNHLRANYPSDDDFKESFKIKRIKDSKKARYLLSEIEHTISGKEKTVNIDPNEVNLEHIAPKKRNQFWNESATGINNDEYNDMVNMIGNLALLSKSSNKSIGNKSFSDKKIHFSDDKSSFITTNFISNYDTWSSDSIKERQEYLSELAVKTWKIEN